MSLRTQRLANRFPLWTKVRKDPSSVGSRLFDTFAEGLEENAITVHRLFEDISLTKRNIGRSFLHEVILQDNDILEPVSDSNGYSWEYPSLTGTLDSVDYSVDRADSLTTLLMSYPTRLENVKSLTSGSRTVWSSEDPYTYNIAPYPERLWIVISGSTFYVDKTPHRDLDKSGYAAIRITGIDCNYQQFTEVLNVFDDGVYITSFVFKEITAITREGFDGQVVITAGATGLPFENDPYRTLVLDDLEGRLELKLLSDDVSFVTYQTNRFKLGRQYRQKGVETIDNVEDLGSFVLRNSASETYHAVSLAVSPANTYLYVLDDNGIVHIYDHGLPEFLPGTKADTISNYVEIETINPYAKYQETEYLWTRFARLKYPLASLEIKRVSPDASVDYLQADRTWNATPYKFTASTSVKPKFSDWVDFRFSTEYNLVGAYEYIATAKTAVDETVFSTQVYCGALTAVASLSAIAGTDLFFADNGNLVIDTGTEAFFFQEHWDKYIIDEDTSHIWMSDQYDSLSVDGTAYDSSAVLLPSGLDEVALKWSLSRLPRENLEAFKNRLLLEYRDPTDNSLTQFKTSPGRQVGLLDVPIAKITLVDTSLRYPRLQVTATKLYWWDNSNEDPVLELDLVHRDEAYFLDDVITALQGISAIAVEIIDVDYQYRFSRQLRLEDTNSQGTSFLQENYVNNLNTSLINSIQFGETTVFKTEKLTSAEVEAEGDYYVDYQNGIVISNNLQSGFCLYTRSDFPLYLYWQPVRVFELNDSDAKLLTKDTLRTDIGDEYQLLNAQGTRYFNELLKAYPLEWGI